MLALRSQLFIHARQPGPMLSCCKPGNASQPTLTHRLRAWMMVWPTSNLGGAAVVTAGVGAVDVAIGAACSLVTGGSIGLLAQPPRLPTISAHITAATPHPMTLIILEALGAGVLLVGIVWWTMFSGRKDGELPPQSSDEETPPKS